MATEAHAGRAARGESKSIGFAALVRLGRSSVVFLFTVCFAAAAFAQAKPEIDFLFPAGARRGTSVEVQVGAELVPGACRLEAAGTGLKITPLGASGRYRIDVAADALLDAAEMRLVVTQGASTPFPFLVGDLPETVRADRRTMKLDLPCVVNARLEAAGVVDEYALELASGRGIVCAVSTQEIRSPVDPMLRLLDAEGRIVAEGFAHRTADQLLVYRAPRAGRYVLQVFDFQLAGGSRNVYRLTATDGPWLDYAFPLSTTQGAAAKVTLHGWNLTPAGATTLEYQVAAQAAGRHVVQLAHAANRLSIPVAADPQQLEREPNDGPDQAQELTLPLGVSGRLQAPGDRDVYAVTLEKGAKLAVDLESASLRFPVDPVLTLANADGKTLQEVDDAQASRDPKLRFTAAAAGRYFLTVRDRAAGGGDDFVYRLRVAEPRPDLTARVNTPNLTLHGATPTNLAVLVDRLDGFGEECEVTALGLPSGVSVAAQDVPAKTPATIQLPFTVKDGTAPSGGLVRIVVRSKNADAPWQREALIAEAANSTTGSSELWVAVSPVIPFTLQTSSTILDAPRLAAFPFPINVKRNDGFTGAIRLVGVRPDQRGTVVPLSGLIPADSTTGTLPLVLQHQVTEGTTHRCRVMGVAEVAGVDGKTYSVFHVADGNIFVGCQPSLLTMTTSPAMVAWRPGEEHELRVQLIRRRAMQPIRLRAEFAAGAKGVTCESATVDEKQNEATLTLRFGADAELPPRSILTLHAESSHDGLPIFGHTTLRLEAR